MTLATWPITAGTEITWRHFEDLRRAVYLKRYHYTGSEYYDPSAKYANHWTPETWSTFAAQFSFDYPHTTLDKTHPQFTLLINVPYQAAGMSSPDLFSIREVSFVNNAAIAATPPINTGDGKLNGNWVYAVDVDRYTDFDQHSGRSIVRCYTAGDGEPFYSRAEGWRYLPKQVTPNHQRPRVKYADNDRDIPNPMPCEINYQFISQPSTMGPNIELTKIYEEGNSKWIKNGKESPGTVGQDYAWPVEWADAPQKVLTVPDDRLPEFEPDDEQQYADEKLCSAYQNFIEQVLCAHPFVTTVNGAYAENFEKLYGEPYKGGGTVISDGAPFWQPTVVYNDDDLLGCSRSSFELALEKLGRFDWYFCTDYPYVPSHILNVRAYMESSHPWLNEYKDIFLPLPSGTWRRTWQHTCGRPKQAAVMLAGAHTPTGYDYADFQAAESPEEDPNIWLGIGWPGIFVPTAHTPTDEAAYLATLSEDSPEAQAAELAALRHRHDPQYVSLAARPAFEDNIVEALNDMWDILQLPQSIGLDLTIQWGTKSATGTGLDDYPGNSRTAYQAARDDYFSQIDDEEFSDFSTAYDITLGSTGNSSANLYTGEATGSFAKTIGRVVLTVDEDTLPLIPRAAAMQLYVLVKPFTFTRDENTYTQTIFRNCVFKVGTLEVSVPIFDLTYYISPRPSTGVPDPIPEAFEAWGGVINRDGEGNPISVGISGSLRAIPLALADMYPIDATHYGLDITIDGDPVVTAEVPDWTYPSPTTQWSHNTYAKTTLSAVALDIGSLVVDLDDAGGEVDFETRRYATFDEVSEDPGKFDDDGRLLPPSEWNELNIGE